MKKKIWMLVSVCLFAICFGACAKKDITTMDFNGMSYDQLKSISEQHIQALSMSSDDELLAILAQVTDSEGTIPYTEITSWVEAREGEGEFVGIGEFNVTTANDTLTTEQLVQYADRDLKLTIVYDYDKMLITAITVDKVYSIGETMSKAGMNTLMGMGVVFAILILISVIIYGFRIIAYLQNRPKKSSQAEGQDKVVEQIVQREEQLQDDLELAAVIAAAVAAATGSSTDDFVVRSIKRR